MSQNPYQPPVAGVEDPHLSTDHDALLGQPRVREAGAGLEWISSAWTLFTANPGMWIVFLILFFGMFLVAQFIPFLGPLAMNLISPVLLGGIMIGCDSLRRGGALELDHLFAGFRERAGPLIILGALYLAVVIVATIIIMVPMFALLGFSILSGSAEMDPTQVGLMIVLFLIGLLIFVPVMALYWFAVPLIAINNVPPVEAMKLSFYGCLKNILPFIIYGLIGLVIAVVATIPLMLGWLVAGPLFMATIYTSYRDIFYES